MPKYKITVTEITSQFSIATAGTASQQTGETEKEVFRQTVEDFDLKTFVRDLNKPTRKKRVSKTAS